MLRFRQWPIGLVLALCTVLVIIVGILDYMTGLEISVAAFYLVPIGLATWAGKRSHGILLAIFSLLAWGAADQIGGAIYTRAYVFYWNAAVLLAFYVIFVWLLSALKASREGLEEQVERRTAALKAAQLQLIQAAKMESVGLLTAGVVHEVKNPLQSVLTGLDRLESLPLGDNAEARGAIRDMRAGIGRASSVINELLVYARPGETSRQPTSLNDLIERALGMLKYDLLKKGIKVVSQMQPSLPLLPIDRNKIEQVFVNVFTNAIQAMPDGGSLTIRTHAGPDGAPDGFLAGEKADPAGSRGPIAVDIDDTGTGIPEENLPRIFDPFFTTRPAGGGTGLGLFIVRQIIDMHGGTIEFKNRHEGGTRCTIRFAADGPAGRPADGRSGV